MNACLMIQRKSRCPKNVRHGREFTEERLGKVEGVCLNMLSNVLGESKADVIRYFQSTTNFPGKVDPRPAKRISTAAGPGPEGDDGYEQTDQNENAAEKSEVEGLGESGKLEAIHEGNGNFESPEDGEHSDMPKTPDFVPSLNDTAHPFATTDESPVERSTKQLL